MKKLAYLLSFIAILVFITGCNSKEAPKKKIIRPVKAMTVGSVSDLVGQGFPAVTKPFQEADISFRVGGPIIKMNVIEGAKVNKGDLVAEIDPRDYIVAEQSAKARYEQAKEEAKRYKRLWQKGAVAKNDYDRKQANYLQAKAKWEDSKNDLKDTKLYAPISGYYGPKFVDVGTEVKPFQPITIISDLSIIEVVTTIPENIAAKFREFESYDVIFDIYPNKVFKATLKEMGKVPKPEGFTLTLYLDHKNNPNNPGEVKITAGMSCRVNINLKESSNNMNFFTVPTAAVFEGETDKTPSVWILEGTGEVRTVKKQHVKLGGFAGNNYVKIESGLKLGQQIVAAGSRRLVEGQKVKILNQQDFH